MRAERAAEEDWIIEYWLFALWQMSSSIFRVIIKARVLLWLQYLITKLVNLTHTSCEHVCVRVFVLVGRSAVLQEAVCVRHLAVTSERLKRHKTQQSELPPTVSASSGGVEAWRQHWGQVAGLQKSRWWPAPPILPNYNARTAIKRQRREKDSLHPPPIIKTCPFSLSHKHWQWQTCSHFWTDRSSDMQRKATMQSFPPQFSRGGCISVNVTQLQVQAWFQI